MHEFHICSPTYVYISHNVTYICIFIYIYIYICSYIYAYYEYLYAYLHTYACIYIGHTGVKVPGDFAGQAHLFERICYNMLQKNYEVKTKHL